MGLPTEICLFSQDLDLGAGSLCFEASPFLVRIENNICLVGIYRNDGNTIT